MFSPFHSFLLRNHWLSIRTGSSKDASKGKSTVKLIHWFCVLRHKWHRNSISDQTWPLPTGRYFSYVVRQSTSTTAWTWKTTKSEAPQPSTLRYARWSILCWPFSDWECPSLVFSIPTNWKKAQCVTRDTYSKEQERNVFTEASPKALSIIFVWFR